MTRSRYALPLLLALLLAACAQPDDLGSIEPMGQEDVTEKVEALAFDLTPLLMSVTEDPGVIALEQFPVAPGLPFAEMGALRTRRPDAALRLLVAYSLPRGAYGYDADQGLWKREGEADSLTLTWPYNPSSGEVATATLTLDWEVGAPTAHVLTPDGQRVELPTDMDVSLVAGDVTAADVNIALDYYAAEGCPEGILEPERLVVDGTGTLLDLGNVGYSVRENEDGDTVTTQGTITLKAQADNPQEDRATFTWDIKVTGDLEREGCYTRSLAPWSGAVATELSASLSGEGQGLAFGFEFADVDPVQESVALRDGYLAISGNPALTFSGRLDDRNGNFVPGEGVRIVFSDGTSTTLEQLLIDLSRGASAFGRLMF